MSHMSAQQTVQQVDADQSTDQNQATETDTWDCGHTHTDGGTRECSTVLDTECIVCLDEHIPGCPVCSR